MLKLFLSTIKNIDKKIINTISKTFDLSLIISIISLYILYLYIVHPISFDLLNSSMLLFKASSSILISGVLSGFAIHTIKNN